jgi:hypothetical protein
MSVYVSRDFLLTPFWGNVFDLRHLLVLLEFMFVNIIRN